MNKLLSVVSKILAVDLAATAKKVSDILSGIVGPCLSVIGSIGVIYLIVIGVQYAKAESDEKRMNMKKRLINLAIGLMVMIVLITLCFAIKWDTIIPEMFGYLDAYDGNL